MDREEERRKEEAVLDEALKQTFPASDPFSVGRFTATEPPARPADRKPPRIGPEGAKPSSKPSRRRKTAH